VKHALVAEETLVYWPLFPDWFQVQQEILDSLKNSYTTNQRPHHHPRQLIPSSARKTSRDWDLNASFGCLRNSLWRNGRLLRWRKKERRHNCLLNVDTQILVIPFWRLKGIREQFTSALLNLTQFIYTIILLQSMRGKMSCSYQLIAEEKFRFQVPRKGYLSKALREMRWGGGGVQKCWGESFLSLLRVWITVKSWIF
jgi:hypothetical protein